jgi:hypothetical protein
MKVQTGLVAEERAKLAGVTRDLQHERKSAEKILFQFGRRSSAALDGVRWRQLACETSVAVDVHAKSEAALAAERKKVARALAGRAKAEEKNAALEDDLDSLMEEALECCVYFTSCLVPLPCLLPYPPCHLHSPLLCHVLGGEGKADVHLSAVEEWKATEKEVKVLAGLVGLCGKKGGPYSLEMAELGMELMSRGMTAPDARGVFIVFMKKAHPDLVLGKDHRVPDANQFKARPIFFRLPPLQLTLLHHD